MNAADQKKYKHEGPQVLLVEGNNDCHVIWALCEALNVPKTFGVYVCESVDLVLSRLNALIQRPDSEIKTIGIVLDADINSARRWQGIKHKLRGDPYTMPDIPDVDGTIIDAVDAKPRIGFWLMPNNVDSGMLEDFCRQLAPSDAIAFAEQCVEDAKEKGFATFKEVHHSKAVIHSYLAWQDEPGKPLGQSITAQVLNPNTEIARKFVNWLQRLFGDGR